MKILKLASFLLAMGFIVTSCKNEKAADDTRESLVQADATTRGAENTAANVVSKKAEPAVPVGPLTSIVFSEDSWDFGEVMEGEKVVHEYAFKNTGKEPLIISNAKGSCGCTVSDWPREPIPVGESGVIKVQFDSKNKGKVGGQAQSKRVTITANTDPAITYITIKGKVLKEEGAANPS